MACSLHWSGFAASVPRFAWLSLFGLAGSVAVFGAMMWNDARAFRRLSFVQLPVRISPAVGETAVNGDGRACAWHDPVAQQRGAAWQYDLFTPPELVLFPTTGAVAVRMPDPVSQPQAFQDESFGLQLLAIAEEPYRLQVTGYVGDHGRWHGMFQNMMTGELVLAAAGREFPDLELTVIGFEVREESIAPPESSATRQRVAIARVRDKRMGTEITLTDRERRPDAAAVAVLQREGDPAPARLRAGESMTTGAATFHVAVVSSSPPYVEVVKTAESEREVTRRILTPRPPAPKPADGT